MKYATKRLIDSVWTLAYEVVDGEVFIHSYDRTNPIGYEKEKELPQVTLLEDDYRVVEEVAFKKYDSVMRSSSAYGEYVQVANPKYVFSYNK
jgi:hypothetical protein